MYVICHTRAPCVFRWTEWDAICQGHSCGPKQHYLIYRSPGQPREGEIWRSEVQNPSSQWCRLSPNYSGRCSFISSTLTTSILTVATRLFFHHHHHHRRRHRYFICATQYNIKMWENKTLQCNRKERHKVHLQLPSKTRLKHFKNSRKIKLFDSVCKTAKGAKIVVYCW